MRYDLFCVSRVSAEMAAFVGKDEISRPELVKVMWAYVKENDLQVRRTLIVPMSPESSHACTSLLAVSWTPWIAVIV